MVDWFYSTTLKWKQSVTNIIKMIKSLIDTTYKANSYEFDYKLMFHLFKRETSIFLFLWKDKNNSKKSFNFKDNSTQIERLKSLFTFKMPSTAVKSRFTACPKAGNRALQISPNFMILQALSRHLNLLTNCKLFTSFLLTPKSSSKAFMLIPNPPNPISADRTNVMFASAKHTHTHSLSGFYFPCEAHKSKFDNVPFAISHHSFFAAVPQK